MKNFYISFILFLALAAGINAQTIPGGERMDGYWQLIPSGVEENLLSVHFANSSTGYIGGEWGRCLKSSNEGFLWTPLASPSTNWLIAVWATSPDNVHLGAWDTVFNTHNGGQTWSSAYLNTVNYYVLDMQFHTADLGYIFLQASAFQKTTDGGDTWSEMTGSGVIDDFNAGYMIDETNGFAVGGAGLICHTTDGGQTWPQYEWNGWTEWTPIYLQGVHFTSAMNGFAVADSGVIFRTTDGGNYWSKTYLAGPDDNLMDIYFTDANHGWIVGYHGIIFSTTDGGENWYQEPVLTTNDLNSVFFISPNLGWAVGNNGTILRFGEYSSSVNDHSLLNPDNMSIFPNPCSAQTSITLNLPGKLDVSIDVYDLSGRKVMHGYDGTLDGGAHVLEISFPELGNGMYFCRLSGSAGNVCKPFVISK